MKLCLERNDIEMYLAHNEGTSIVAKRFTRICKKKIYKYLTLILKNVYFDKLDDRVNQCNITYHSTIKLQPVYVKWNTHIESSKEINKKKTPKFKVDDIDRIRISK